MTLVRGYTHCPTPFPTPVFLFLFNISVIFNLFNFSYWLSCLIWLVKDRDGKRGPGRPLGSSAGRALQRSEFSSKSGRSGYDSNFRKRSFNFGGASTDSDIAYDADDELISGRTNPFGTEKAKKAKMSKCMFLIWTKALTRSNAKSINNLLKFYHSSIV